MNLTVRGRCADPGRASLASAGAGARGSPDRRLLLGAMKRDLQLSRRGDFSVGWPDTVVRDISSNAEAEVLVIRATSLADDKIQLGDADGRDT